MDNSFSNITKRKRQQSTNSLEETFINDDSINSDNDYSSLPDLELRSSFDFEQALELKTKINQLKIELLSAHQEIDNLNRENKDLSNELQESKKNINALKSLLNSDKTLTPKFSTAKKSKKRKSNATKLNDVPVLQINDTNMILKHSNTENEIKKNCNKIIDKKEREELKQLQNLNIINDMKHRQVKPMRKITILGDQQGVGLTSELIKNRLNTNNINNYDISGITYPNAPIEYFATAAASINKESNEDDWVVLSIGSNDWNPVKFNIDLAIILNILSKPKVIITSVIKNIYINEIKLNHLINVVTKNFKNCFYVDLSSYMYKTNYFLYQMYCIAELINKCINIHDYRIQYIEKCTKIKLTNPSKPKVITYKRGTIPYYFRINKKEEKNIISSNTKLNITEKCKKNKLKGTIPYYFHYIDRQNDSTFFRE